jgi:hypothetical protein
MQSLNDDMDELFRRASEEYPLNTDGADWNKVMQQLDHEDGALTEEDKKKRDFKFLWLLLLLPIGFICGRYIGNNNKSAFVNSAKETRIAASPVDKSVSKETTLKPKSEGLKGSNAGILKREKISPVSKVNETQPSTNTTSFVSNNKLKKSAASRVGEPGLLVKSSILKQPKTNSDNDDLKGVIENSAKKISSDNNARKDASMPVKSSSDEVANGEVKPDNILPNAVQNVINSSDKKTISDTPLIASKVIESKRNIEQKNKAKLSYSLVLGPDISTVKGEKTSHLGYTAGVVLKYQLSRRISVEGGLLWAKKNYYSDGKYFDTSGLKLPMHSVVKTAEGYCKMFEIPVNIRYDFLIKKNYALFVSTGLSSYLMKREAYDLSYQRYNQLYTKEYGYDNSSKNWFSIMNLSLGYQRSIGKSTTVGFAPYIKLPLRGVGVGKLPVSSKGLYLTLTRSIR